MSDDTHLSWPLHAYAIQRTTCELPLDTLYLLLDHAMHIIGIDRSTVSFEDCVIASNADAKTNVIQPYHGGNNARSTDIATGRHISYT